MRPSDYRRGCSPIDYDWAADCWARMLLRITARQTARTVKKCAMHTEIADDAVGSWARGENGLRNCVSNFNAQNELLRSDAPARQTGMHEHHLSTARYAICLAVIAFLSLTSAIAQDRLGTASVLDGNFRMK